MECLQTPGHYILFASEDKKRTAASTRWHHSIKPSFLLCAKTIYLSEPSIQELLRRTSSTRTLSHVFGWIWTR